MRDLRSQKIEEVLSQGKTVAYRSSGWSLWPRVHSGDLCCYLPARAEEQVVMDDIVLCKVQPYEYYCAHLIHSIEWGEAQGTNTCWTSNLKGTINGDCYLEHILGKMYQVLRH